MGATWLLVCMHFRFEHCGFIERLNKIIFCEFMGTPQSGCVQRSLYGYIQGRAPVGNMSGIHHWTHLLKQWKSFLTQLTDSKFVQHRIADPSQRENLGIIVQYKVKVKLVIGGPILGGWVRSIWDEIERKLRKLILIVLQRSCGWTTIHFDASKARGRRAESNTAGKITRQTDWFWNK